MIITSGVFDPSYPNITEYSLISQGLIVKVINLGASITSIQYRSGDQKDVVLGYNTVEEYKRYDNYFGATIGRCANRIKDATFSLNNKTYTLEANDHTNALHGGVLGLHGRIFDAYIEDQVLVFHYVSKDMEEGYPGTLDLHVYFELKEHALHIRYEAVSDKDTMINFTNHSYFALQGHGEGSVDHQILRMNALLYAPNDEQRLVKGNLESVKDTPFDFYSEKVIGRDIGCMNNEQIRYANGYDHYFRFCEDKEHVVELYDPITKHSLKVKSDMPGFHFYVPDYKIPCIGKDNYMYQGHCACCVETSFMPDAIHVQDNPETILKANTKFASETIYEFF